MRTSCVSLILFALAATGLSGCASSYSWSSRVPENLRTVAVPTFLNKSGVVELGGIMSAQLLREFQREGTFKIRSAGDAALEIQGTVISADSQATTFNRRTRLRVNGYDFTAKVSVSVVDKRHGRVLVDNRVFEARTTYAAGRDGETGNRDASGRLADDLAQQVVDFVCNLKWEEDRK